jgi:hypothetical protein
MASVPEYRDGPTAALPTTAGTVAALAEIRACVHRWIDALEERLDRETPAAAATSRDLEQAAFELEQRREALRAEVERREREWAERLEALEHDRRLLAEAWERLERARVAAPPPIALAPAGPPAAPVAAASALVAANDGPGNPVDRLVLRQFEALRRDVRRAAEARLPS